MTQDQPFVPWPMAHLCGKVALDYTILYSSHINTPSFHFNVYAFSSSQLGDEFILETYGITWSSLYNMLTKVLNVVIYLP